MCTFNNDYSNGSLESYYAIGPHHSQPNIQGSSNQPHIPQLFSFNQGLPLYNIPTVLQSTSTPQPALNFSLLPNIPQRFSAPPAPFFEQSPLDDLSHSTPSMQPAGAVSAAASLQQYKGRRACSKYGTNRGLIYRISETRVAYAFSFQRKNKSADVYRCCFCKAVGVCTTVKVKGDEFLTDPCSIGHRCSPRTCSGTCHTDGKMDDIRSDDLYTNKSGKRLWLNTLQEINEDNSNDDSLKDQLLEGYFAHGYDDRKGQFSRNLASHKDKRASMGFVPEELEKLADESAFFQKREDSLHIYYSMDTIQKACNVGLQAIVADGVHTPQRKELGRHSQL